MTTLPSCFRARKLAFGAAALLTCATPMFAQQGPGGAPSATQVGVIEMSLEKVPYQVTLPGRAVAYEQTDIRPRVEGVIEEIVYAPGQQLEVGDLMYRIEAASYDAELAAAEAALAGAKASVQSAQATVDRYRQLDGVGVTRESVETAEVALMQAEADERAAEASLQTAQLNKDRTEIRAPIQGVPEVSEFSVGALVTANQADALTTLTRLDPIYVDLTESSARLLRTRERIADGQLTMGDELDVSLTLENGQSYDSKGSLVSPGTLVSSTTGGVEFRIQFDNPDRLIMPGMFLRAHVTVGETEAVLVPQGATNRAATGELTAFVAVDGKAEQVTLTSQGTYQNAWVVTDGIEDGDMLIVDGLRNLRNGADVETVAVTIDENGVVSDAVETADAE
ncbi:efflux RND transporter periplasmic adaptor subunit [Donghicola sp.]|uniref:efflux RND transporter periplasmic adaptor subunit n=1 Tax=Donghicola sp. TaxID=1929294 RepID=UPI0025FBA2F3|nr:efflux RND transporter periplasmic adaptor subunit [Donghicola sp.]MCT4578700.1 efflux RND transporter periplasmic adaptor subunit [Donghicola sp.]